MKLIYRVICLSINLFIYLFYNIFTIFEQEASTAKDEGEKDVLDINVVGAMVFVIAASAFLLLLFFFMSSWFVYVLIIMFVIGGSEVSFNILKFSHMLLTGRVTLWLGLDHVSLLVTVCVFSCSRSLGILALYMSDQRLSFVNF